MSNLTIIDTRESFEFASGHVKSALNIPPSEFLSGDLPTQLKNINKNQEIIVYCRSGSRSNVVLHILKQHGFTSVKNGINQQQVEKYLGRLA